MREEKLVNLGTAFVLLAAYVLYLVFMLKTHPDFFQSVDGEDGRSTRASTALESWARDREPGGRLACWRPG